MNPPLTSQPELPLNFHSDSNSSESINAVISTTPSPHCILCGKPGILLFKNLEDQLYGAPGKWNLVKCESPDCGLIWLNPAPKADQISKAYRQYYTHDEGSETFFRKLFKNLYFKISQIPEYCVGLAQARKRMKALYLDQQFPGNLLDIGCGDGLYMHHMQKLGWKTEGIDFDEKALNRARSFYGLNVRQIDLFDASYPDGTFTAVTLRHVIEHLPDPLATLSECLRILSPGGTLVVVTPNSESLGYGLTFEDWRGLEIPRHLHIFSWTTLKLCAKRLGIPPEQYQVFTTATGADYILDESFALQERLTDQKQAQTGPKTIHFLRTLRAIALQYREQLSLRFDPSIGEEAVLIIHKK